MREKRSSRHCFAGNPCKLSAIGRLRVFTAGRKNGTMITNLEDDTESPGVSPDRAASAGAPYRLRPVDEQYSAYA